jgi:hypothetical protein
MWQFSLSLVYLTLMWSSSKAQENDWPPTGWADTSRYFVHTKGGWTSTRTLYGTVALRNGDTLNQCYVRPWYYYCKILPHNSFQQTTISNKDILYIRSKTPFSNGYVEFRPIYKNPMWRLVRQKGKVSIYDFSDTLNLSVLGSPIVLVTADRITRINGSLAVPSLRSKNAKILLFVNRRYRKTFNRSDFPTNQDMLDYIIDEETNSPTN